MIEEHAQELATIQHPLVGSPTIVPVLVAGGEAFNMVPERCTLTFDRRLVPGEEEAAVVTGLTALIERFNREQPGLTARVTGFAPSTGGPSETAADDPFVLSAVAALRDIGQEGELGGMQVNCDMSHFRNAGMPTMVYGPGDPRAMHTIEESISLAELDRGTDGYYAIVSAMLHGR
jgi:acetylornithine deacetylase/succinyl-diaminopimelate desuccinylase-like protein